MTPSPLPPRDLHWAALIVALGVVLHFPVLHLGFALDDFAQIAMAEGHYPSPRHPLDLFTFSKGSDADNRALMETGFYPWWSHPKLRLSMFRPLSSALTQLDLWLWGHDAFVHHLHSLLWWLLMLGAVYRLLRSQLPAATALLSLGLFVVDEPQTIGLGWLANRNALVAVTCSAVALRSYIRYREHGTVRDAGNALLSYTAALASGEYGLAALGYFLAFELLARADPMSTRLRALSWVVGPALLFLVARYVAGAGARFSDMYVDPIRSPFTFAKALLQRFPALMADATMGLRSDYWSFGAPWSAQWVELGLMHPSQAFDLPALRRRFELIAIPGLLLFAVLLRFVGKNGRVHQSGHAVWLSLGGALSMLPLVGSMPGSRLLLLPGIGIAALLGTCTRTLIHRVRVGERRMLSALACLALLYVHGLGAAQRARAEGQAVRAHNERLRGAALHLPMADEGLADKHVVVISSDPLNVIYTGMMRRQYGRTSPRSVRVLSGANFDCQIKRDDARTLTLRMPPQRALLAGPHEHMFRSQDSPLPRGSRVALEGMTVEVLADVAGRPTIIRATFDRPLEATNLQFVTAQLQGFVPLQPPAVGQAMYIPAPMPPLWAPREAP